jgi:hypothetical protein
MAAGVVKAAGIFGDARRNMWRDGVSACLRINLIVRSADRPITAVEVCRLVVVEPYVIPDAPRKAIVYGVEEGSPDLILHARARLSAAHVLGSP